MSSRKIEYIQTPFGKLACKIDGGDKAGTPLLIAQRFRGTIDDWDTAFIDAISRDRKVISFDSAGIGRSEGEVPESVTGMADVASALIDALDLKQVDLLGWSLGGYVAQILSLRSPDLVRKLIIAGSGPGKVPDAPPQNKDVAAVGLHEVLTDEDLMFLFSSGSKDSRAAIALSQSRIREQATGPAVTMASALRQRSAIGGWWNGTDSARPNLPKLTVPILVANGVNDIMIPAFSSYVISQEAPNAKLVLYPDSGHGFLFQYIEEFADEISRFLA